MLSSSSTHSARCARTAASPLLAWICTASGKNAAAALIAGIIRVCRTRSRAATYFPASAAPTRLAIMKRSVTLEIASKVSDRVSGRPVLATAASPAPSNLTIVPRQAVRDCTSTREQIGQRGRQQQQETGRADKGNDNAKAKHGGGADQRGLHDRERHQPGANQVLGQLEQPDRDREHDCGERRRGVQSDQPPQAVGDRRGEAADQVSRNHEAADVGAVVAGVPAQDQVAEPADQENADDGREANAQQIDAVIMRRKQPRENEHAQ